ncbi:MAG: hypothetical protein HC836_10640 [Richelia sp. RM2_1_2]|nr:hypothetical protein [Richelia sp. RM2_1_2]
MMAQTYQAWCCLLMAISLFVRQNGLKAPSSSISVKKFLSKNQLMQLTVDESGNKEWRKDGVLHRIDGPAVIWPDGSKEWYKNGRLHRIDGPAIEWVIGTKDGI